MNACGCSVRTVTVLYENDRNGIIFDLRRNTTG
jgi:hypothetical protein